MSRLIAMIAVAAALTPAAASAQTLTPEQQAQQSQRNLEAQQQRDKVETARQLRQSQNLNIKAQDNAAALQVQTSRPLVNPGLQPGAPIPYASSSAAARGAAQTGAAVSTSTVVPDMVGGPLNLPGPTDPQVKNYTVSPEPAADQPASTTPVR